MPYYLSRPFPFDIWRVTTERPTEGDIIELPDCHWFSEAQAEADRLNGKRQDGEQGVLGI